MSFLAEEAARGAHYQLVIAADVFVYFHDLTDVVPAVRDVLEPDGLLAFSLETHAGDGVILHETLRYAHGAAHAREGAGRRGAHARQPRFPPRLAPRRECPCRG